MTKPMTDERLERIQLWYNALPMESLDMLGTAGTGSIAGLFAEVTRCRKRIQELEEGLRTMTVEDVVHGKSVSGD